MTLPKKMTVDGNEAAASVAYRINEVAAIYSDHPLVDDGRARRRVGRSEHDLRHTRL